MCIRVIFKARQDFLNTLKHIFSQILQNLRRIAKYPKERKSWRTLDLVVRRWVAVRFRGWFITSTPVALTTNFRFPCWQVLASGTANYSIKRADSVLPVYFSPVEAVGPGTAAAMLARAKIQPRITLNFMMDIVVLRYCSWIALTWIVASP